MSFVEYMKFPWRSLKGALRESSSHLPVQVKVRCQELVIHLLMAKRIETQRIDKVPRGAWHGKTHGRALALQAGTYSPHV